MNFPSIRFVFDRKNVASKTVKGLVQIEILYKRKRKWIGTGIRLLKHQWDENFHVVRSSTAIEDNQALDSMMMNIKDVVRSIINDDDEFSFAAFNDRYRKRYDVTFIAYMEEMINSSNMARNSKATHNGVLNGLKEFGKIISFDDISLYSIMEYDKFLKKERTRKDKEHTIWYFKPTSIVYMHGVLQKYINMAIRDGYIKFNPYLQFDKGKHKYGERAYLTQDEMKTWNDVQVPSYLETARNMFLFQCYTGISFIDMMTLDFRNCIVNRNGTNVINGKRVKTNERYYVVIVRQAMEILEKVNYDFSSERRLATYNAHLKCIASICGIEKNLSSHIGRHTFAVFALNNGIPIEIVAKILGHTDIKTTQVYAKIVDKSVEDSFCKLEGLI